MFRLCSPLVRIVPTGIMKFSGVDQAPRCRTPWFRVSTHFPDSDVFVRFSGRTLFFWEKAVLWDMGVTWLVCIGAPSFWCVITLRQFSICTFYCRSTKLDLALHHTPIRLQITLTPATHQNSCFPLPPPLTTGTVIDFCYTTRVTKPLVFLFKFLSCVCKFSTVQNRPFSLVYTVIMVSCSQYITLISVCSPFQCQMVEILKFSVISENILKYIQGNIILQYDKVIYSVKHYMYI